MKTLFCYCHWNKIVSNLSNPFDCKLEFRNGVTKFTLSDSDTGDSDKGDSGEVGLRKWSLVSALLSPLPSSDRVNIGPLGGGGDRCEECECCGIFVGFRCGTWYGEYR